MVFLRGRGFGLLFAGVLSITCLPKQTVFAQVGCTKPDAGSDVTSNAASIKLKDAPNGYFWTVPSGNPNTSASIHAQTGQVTGLSTPGTYKFVLSSVASSLSLHAAQAIPQDGPLKSNTLNGLDVLDNGQIKVGVDSRYGGAITYLSTKTGINMVNNYDRGRQIQIGIYGGPVPFNPPGVEQFPAWSGIGWNPIQAGDFYNNVSRILAYEKRDNLIYVKTLPKFWPLNNYDGEAVIEHWIRLSGNVVKVHARVTLSRADKKQYDARDQEFPCLYLNSSFKRSWRYTGSEPFTNADKQLKIAPFDMVNVRATEPWVALTRDDNFGVGLYSPKNFFFREAFFGNEFSDNEAGSNASYIAATPFAVLDHNSVSDFDYELIVGHINDIRSYVYAQPRPDTGPNYRFTDSRLNWHMVETNDTGLPINKYIQINLNGVGSQQLKSPAVSWRGKDNPKVYVRAAFALKGGQDSYRFHWQNLEDPDFQGSGNRIKDFKIINDGQFHTYEIDLAGTTWLSSHIRQVMFRPAWEGPAVSGTFKLEWFSTDPNGPPTAQPQMPTMVCTDTIAITVPPIVPMPDAGPDLTLRCGVSSVNLPTSAAGYIWRILSKPVGSPAVVTAQGNASNLTMPGNYLLTLSNDATRTIDLMAITVPVCATAQSLSSVVYLDNGHGGGIARNGRQEPSELGIANVSITLYTDPNGDGNPADGKVVERTRTDSKGMYRLAQLYPNEIYIVALDASNFDVNQPLWKKVSTRQTSYSPIYGLLSSQLVLPATVAASRVKIAEPDPSFGLILECNNLTCVPISIRRL